MVMMMMMMITFMIMKRLWPHSDDKRKRFSIVTSAGHNEPGLGTFLTPPSAAHPINEIKV